MSTVTLAVTPFSPTTSMGSFTGAAAVEAQKGRVTAITITNRAIHVLCTMRITILLGADHVFDVADPLAQQIQLVSKPLNIAVSAAVDVEVEFAAQPVFFVLAVLAHHDYRG